MISKIVRILALLALLTGSAQAAQSVTFYHHDALGSVIAKSDADGYLYLNEEYQPYGEKIYGTEDPEGNEDWYTGQNYSEDLDLSYFGARWYDAKQGRFLSIDPASVSLASIHSFNRYHYANSNPYRYVDPNGEQAIDDDDVDGAGFDPLDSEEIDDATLSIGGGPRTRFVDGIKVHSIGAMGAGGAGGPGIAGGSRTRPDFIVSRDGAVVPNSPAATRQSLEGAGISGRKISNPSGTESGTIHNVPGMRMDIRVMDGGPVHQPRVITTRQGTSQPVNPSSGSNFGNVPGNEQRERNHILFSE